MRRWTSVWLVGLIGIGCSFDPPGVGSGGMTIGTPDATTGGATGTTSSGGGDATSGVGGATGGGDSTGGATTMPVTMSTSGGMADTGPATTSVADTGPADTGVDPDTGPPPPPPADPYSNCPGGSDVECPAGQTCVTISGSDQWCAQTGCSGGGDCPAPPNGNAEPGCYDVGKGPNVCGLACPFLTQNCPIGMQCEYHGAWICVW